MNTIAMVKGVTLHGLLLGAMALVGVQAYKATPVVTPAPKIQTWVPAAIPDVTPAPEWVKFDVVRRLDEPKNGPERHLKPKRIVLGDGRITVAATGVNVDGEQMDTSDLALRAFTAWLASASPGIACGTPADCENIDTIFAGATRSSAGVELQIEGKQFMPLYREAMFRRADDGPFRQAQYMLFMHWLHIARAGDKRFARQLKAIDVFRDLDE